MDKIVKKLQKYNYPVKMMPKENWYRKGDILLGDKEMLVMGPDGHLLRFSEDIETKSIKHGK